MKKIDLVKGNNYIVNLGKKFKNTRVLATFIEAYEGDENVSVVKPLKIVDGSKMTPSLYMALRCQIVIDNVQILA